MSPIARARLAAPSAPTLRRRRPRLARSCDHFAIASRSATMGSSRRASRIEARSPWRWICRKARTSPRADSCRRTSRISRMARSVWPSSAATLASSTRTRHSRPAPKKALRHRRDHALGLVAQSESGRGPGGVVDENRILERVRTRPPVVADIGITTQLVHALGVSRGTRGTARSIDVTRRRARAQPARHPRTSTARLPDAPILLRQSQAPPSPVSARPPAGGRLLRIAMSLANSILHTASMARWALEAVTDVPDGRRICLKCCRSFRRRLVS